MAFRQMIAMAILVFTSVSAVASDYGRWSCNDSCFSPNDNSPATPLLPEIVLFLRSNKITEQWKPNDTISVCDGSWCSVIIWRTTVWAILTPSYPDLRLPYKNGSRPNFSGNTPSGFNGGYSLSISGHFEYWDYYSNGVYIGSSEKQFVIDSVTTNSSVAQMLASQRRFVSY